MQRKWVLVAISAALVGLLLAACGGNEAPATAPPQPTQATATASDGDAALERVQGAVQNTAVAGDAQVKVRAKARMPEAFDDGVPSRTFTGEGVADQDNELAGVTFDVSQAPNAAGYFGQVDDDMPVYYDDESFTMTFGLLSTSLTGRLAWLRYELPYFDVPKLQELGIGQLREVALSDPLLALSLLRGTVRASDATETGATGAVVAEVDPLRAAQSGFRSPKLRHLADLLGGGTVPVTVQIDDEDRIENLSFNLSYTPAPGSKMVRLRLRFSFSYGESGALRPPRPAEVADYREYLGI